MNEDQKEALRRNIAEAEQALADGTPLRTLDDVLGASDEPAKETAK